MVTRAQRIKLGIFLVTVASTVLVLFILFAGLSFEKRVHYYLDVESSIGLDADAPVTLRGVRVGSVEDIELGAEGFQNVKVTLGVRADVPIASDATAYLQTEGVGVSGLKFVDITGGTPESPPLPPGSKIPVGKTTLERVAERAEDLVERANRVFADFERVSEAIRSVADSVDPQQVARIIRNIDRTTGQLEGVLRENRRNLRGTTAQAERAFAHADETIVEFKGLAGDLRSVVQRNSDTLQASLRNLRDASRDFEQLARELKNQPSRVLFGQPPKERELP